MKTSDLIQILTLPAIGSAVDTLFRVRYGETDKMGVAYYGAYLDWFENGRTELIRARGLSYRQMETEGLFLPVRETFCRYRAPLEYDDEFTLRTELCLIGKFKVAFRNTVYIDGALRAQGGTLHVATGTDGKITAIPEHIKTILPGAE